MRSAAPRSDCHVVQCVRLREERGVNRHLVRRGRVSTLRTKLKAVECAKSSSKEVAARELRVDCKGIRVWCNQKEQLIVLKI